MKKKASGLVILLFLSCLGLMAAVQTKDGSDYHSARSVFFEPAYMSQADFDNSSKIDWKDLLVLAQDSSTEYMPVEMVISRRMSIRQFDLNVAVPWELVSKVLWAAHGYSWRGRTVPSLSGYPIIIYVCNWTAAYKFVPENQSLTLWKEGDYRGLGGGVDAPTQLYIILDMNVCPDSHWGNADSGCTIQNIYLMANALNLGTVCQYRRTDIHEGLGLPAHEKILYKMPLGYPLPPYANYQNLVPTSRQSSPELPEIQDSNVSFEDALNSVFSSHEWSENPVTKQELSQVLWASYGYSYYEDTATTPPTRHRTVPSAHAYYPMKVYAANSSGVYEYLPEQHTLTTIVTEDRRQSIAQASGNAWASSAPLIIAVAYVENSSAPYYIGGDETYVEVGLITQNVYLESAAWGLIADWGKADVDEEAMREALGLIEETLHPVSIITVGHPSTYQHKVLSNGITYTVSIFTNSCITNFGDKTISFNVTGSADTIGFCNVTLPKEMLYGTFTVLIDGTPIDYTLTENATHTSLHFTYNHTTHYVQIIVTPIAYFTYSPINPLVNETVTFNATLSTPNGGTIINYTWDFGDGFYGEGMVTYHNYSETGTYNVTLTVIDNEELAHTAWATVAVSIHGVTVVSVTPSTNEIYEEQTMNITVVVQNNGNFTETFNVTAYANATIIQTLTVSDLAPANQTTLTFLWNTTGVSLGNYTMSAEASVVPGETYATDNVKVNGTVNVIPEFASILLLLIVFLATTIVTITIKKRLSNVDTTIWS